MEILKVVLSDTLVIILRKEHALKTSSLTSIISSKSTNNVTQNFRSTSLRDCKKL